MKKEIAERWIDKLRNGNIPQLIGILGMVNGRRCCLGVLCDIAVEDGIIGTLNTDQSTPRDPLHPGPIANKVLYGTKLDDMVLPEEVIEWAEMNSNSGEIASNGATLAAMNDNGVPFTAIADIIEKNVDKL